MAIRIICTQCQKQISIDSAFAGGICRCPYCKALVKVRKVARTQDADEQQARPDAPPSRYDSLSETPPSGRPAGEFRPATPQNLNILDARPVLFQGISGFVLLSLALAAILGAIALYVGLKPAEPTKPSATIIQQIATRPAYNLSLRPSTEPSAVSVAIVDRPTATPPAKPTEQPIVKPAEKPVAIVEIHTAEPSVEPVDPTIAVDAQAKNRVERPFARADFRPNAGTERPPPIPAITPKVAPTSRPKVAPTVTPTSTPTVAPTSRPAVAPTVALVVAATQPVTQPEIPTPPEEPEAKAPPVLDITIHEPVIFCLDASTTFRQAYSYAATIAIHYINGLQDQDKYNVILAGNVHKWLNANNYAVHGSSKLPTNEFFSSMPSSEQNGLLNAVDQAISQRPSTIVVFSNKNLPAVPARRIGERAKTARTTIICVALDATEGSAQGLGTLATSSGGQVKYFTKAELDELVSKFKDEE